MALIVVFFLVCNLPTFSERNLYVQHGMHAYKTIAAINGETAYPSCMFNISHCGRIFGTIQSIFNFTKYNIYVGMLDRQYFQLKEEKKCIYLQCDHRLY